jgi:hypothetical protein
MSAPVVSLTCTVSFHGSFFKTLYNSLLLIPPYKAFFTLIIAGNKFSTKHSGFNVNNCNEKRL